MSISFEEKNPVNYGNLPQNSFLSAKSPIPPSLSIPFRFSHFDLALFAATRILQAGQFLPMPEDKGRTLQLGRTISEVQGSRPLRRAARLFSFPFGTPFQPQILRKARGASERNFRIMQIKRVGHALNLEAEVSLKDGSRFTLSGFNESYSIPMVVSSLLEYAGQGYANIPLFAAEWISDVLLHSTSNDFSCYKDSKRMRDIIRDPYRRSLLSSISSGFDWHGMHLFLFSGFLVVCNRGAGSGSKPGISVYKIGNCNAISGKLLSSLIKRQSVTFKKWNSYCHISSLEKKLDLKLVYYFRQKTQKVGNCTYSSTKCAVRALLAIHYLLYITCGNPEILRVRDWEIAFQLTKKGYKEWSLFDKNLVVQDMMLDRKKGEFEDSQVISKEEMQKVWELVKKKIVAKPDKFSPLTTFLINYMK